MARKEARVFTSIWADPAFRALPARRQRMYLYLLSQPDLSFCGVISLRERRWSRDASDLTVDDVRDDLAALAAAPVEGAPLVLVDEETEELLVRSLIRHDGVWKVPNVFKSARAAAEDVQSPEIRAALLAELERIPAGESESRLIREIHAGFVDDLRRSLPNPSGNPSPNLSPNPSASPSAKGSAKGCGNPSANPSADRSIPAVSADQGPTANPSAKGSANPYGNPSANPSQGKGERNGSSRTVPPPPVPFPPPPGDGSAAENAPHAAVTHPTEEGAGNTNTSDPLAALVAEVKTIRPEWSERSIRRALTRPAVAERPAPIVRRAILAVARDHASHAPGRVEHDGPWWRLPDPPPPLPAPPRPEPWMREPAPNQSEINARGREMAKAALAAARDKRAGGDKP